jgi:hypothetical protein
MRKRAVRLPLLLTLIGGAACQGHPHAPSYRLLTLPSGAQVKVLGVQPLVFPKSGPALMLRYQTDLPVDDTTGLAREAEDIWALFRENAESAHVAGAVISAVAPPSGGMVSHTRGFNFVYVRDSAGIWQRASQRWHWSPLLANHRMKLTRLRPSVCSRQRQPTGDRVG